MLRINPICVSAYSQVKKGSPFSSKLFQISLSYISNKASVSFFLSAHLRHATSKLFRPKKRVSCCLILTSGNVIIGRKIGLTLLLSTFLTKGLLHFCRNRS